MSETPRKPEIQYRDKGLNVSVWGNKRGYSISIQKRYCDKASNEWKETKIIFPNEIDGLIHMLMQASRYIEQNVAPTLDGPPVESAPVPAPLKPTEPAWEDDDIPF